MVGEDTNDISEHCEEIFAEGDNRDRREFFWEATKMQEKPYNPCNRYTQNDLKTVILVPDSETGRDELYVILWVIPDCHQLYVTNEEGALKILPTGIK